MRYLLSCQIECDTRTNKVIITHEDKRIVFFPGKKAAEHWTDVLVNDRPITPFSYAKDLCRFLCQNLHGRKQQKRLVDGIGLDG